MSRSVYRRHLTLCRGVLSLIGGVVLRELGARYVAVVILAGVGVLSVVGLQKLERWLAPWREFAIRT